MDGLEFEWDELKNLENQVRHGVSFQDAKYPFYDPLQIVSRDENHSDFEHRYLCLGLDKERNRVLTVRFNYRKGNIRIFGAGYWRRGRRIYAKENQIQR